MNRGINQTGPATLVRVGRRRAGFGFHVHGKGLFDLGDEVRSLTQVKNNGIYPHRDVGEILVREGDAGYVRENWSFLGEIYYTVEFVSRSVVVIMRGKEMERASPAGQPESQACNRELTAYPMPAPPDQ